MDVVCNIFFKLLVVYTFVAFQYSFDFEVHLAESDVNKHKKMLTNILPKIKLFFNPLL